MERKTILDNRKMDSFNFIYPKNGNTNILIILIHWLYFCILFTNSINNCVCVTLLNQHCNTRFTAPACQDSLWPPTSRHHPVHPVKKQKEKMQLRLAVTEGGTIGGFIIFDNQQLKIRAYSYKETWWSSYSVKKCGSLFFSSFSQSLYGLLCALL